MSSPETHDHTESHGHHHEHDRFAFYALVVFMIVLVIIAAQNFWQSEQYKKLQATHATTQQSSIEPNIPLVEARSLDAFPDLADAMFIVNTSQGMKENDLHAEKIVNNIVEAEEERVVYFTTSQMISNTETSVGLYRMNTVSKRWQRIDKLSYKKELVNRYLRVIGRQGNDLLLFYDDTSRKDLPCQSYWLMGAITPFQILHIDVTHPYEELKPWTASAGFIDSEKERIKTCQATAK